MFSNNLSLSQQRWVFLLLIFITAAVLRFWQLDAIPLGLYRDEAFNGLDALGVLDGQTPLYFEANNGREPFYIYITSFFAMFFGRSVWTVRLGAAVMGTFATLIIYKWAAAWFDEQIGLLTAWFWAVTVWPIHLSRIGFRVVTLVPFLALAAWLGTVAYKRQRAVWWFAAGMAYGLSFYTYLAVRFTPILLVVFALYLWWQKRHRPLIKGLLWLGVGFGLALLPLLWVGWQQPELFLGRTGQVSILSEDINNGDFWGTLMTHIGRSLGLFFWAGDDIIRHNPAGRPLFDPLIAVPFVIGVGWCLVHWRKSAAMGALLWTAVMLGPTILAEDAPHFLRGVGILPATLIFPAIGLSWLLSSPKLDGSWRKVGFALILLVSFSMTLNDYFRVYGQDADTGYLFEAAARHLTEGIDSEPEQLTVVWDETRYWSNWPSVQFLLDPNQLPISYEAYFDHQAAVSAPSVWYLWPYENERLASVVQQVTAPAMISAEVGSLARGDLEPDAYPFYVRYEVSTQVDLDFEESITFNNQYELHVPSMRSVMVDDSTNSITVDLYWSSRLAADARPDITAFVHVLDTESGTLSGQSDTIPAQGYLPSAWWPAEVVVHDQHQIMLASPFNRDRHQILVGLYPVGQADLRLPILDAEGQPVQDNWRIIP